VFCAYLDVQAFSFAFHNIACAFLINSTTQQEAKPSVKLVNNERLEHPFPRALRLVGIRQLKHRRTSERAILNEVRGYAQGWRSGERLE
jgi:hypothetical protein